MANRVWSGGNHAHPRFEQIPNVYFGSCMLQTQQQVPDWKAVSPTGGYCYKASTSRGGQHITDETLASALADFFSNQAVAGFGDGPGVYKALIEGTGKVQTYDAFDGTPYAEDVTNGSVKFLDLTAPQYGLKAYDWILCLEVAEHIPRQYEAIFLSNLVRHARNGTVLSWGRPRQGGLAHVNNRPIEYITEKMRDRGFRHDLEATQLLRNACSREHLSRNMNVFVRLDRDSFRGEDI